MKIKTNIRAGLVHLAGLSRGGSKAIPQQMQ
jgi:hypothetical protein